MTDQEGRSICRLSHYAAQQAPFVRMSVGFPCIHIEQSAEEVNDTSGFAERRVTKAMVEI